jgi:hypothetical protein
MNDAMLRSKQTERAQGRVELGFWDHGVAQLTEGKFHLRNASLVRCTECMLHSISSVLPVWTARCIGLAALS